MQQSEPVLSSPDDLRFLMDYIPEYGDPACLNKDGIIRSAVGESLLREIVSDYLELLGTSSAIYEKDGHYAFGIFSSGWCQCLDSAAFRRCETQDIVEAFKSGKWLCHESCWTDCSKECIDSNRPVDIECHGGLHIYSVPITAGGEVIGAINFGYGTPPSDSAALSEIAVKYGLETGQLEAARQRHPKQNEDLIANAKRRLRTSALLIGKVVESHMGEKQLRQSEDLLRLVVRHDSGASAIFDSRMNCLACSQKYLDFYGVTEEQVIGINHYEAFPNFPAELKAVHDRVLQGAVEKSEDDTFLREDGEIVYTRWQCRPWFLADGSIGGMVFQSEDISGRKKGERRLRIAKEEAEQKSALLDAMLNNLDDGIMVLDMDGNMVFANEAEGFIYEAAGANGCSARDYLQSVFELRDMDDRVLPLEDWPISRIYAGEVIRSMEIRARRMDTDRKWVFHVSGTPLYDAKGEQSLVLLVSRDMTEAKSREEHDRILQSKMEQTQRLESLGVLAGGIAHDFNNLLMAIIGHADLALMELPRLTPVASDIEAIKTSSRRAADLCTQLLAYSGKGKLEETSFSMSDLVREMVHMLKTCISKSCLLNLNLAKQLPPTLGDPSQMRQIVMNFVLNASDAIGERSGIITISTGAMECTDEYLADGCILQPEAPGLYVWLEVSDTGAGMDRETMEHVFEPFFTTKFSGRGLGLSAVLGIIRSHGGGLRVYSEPGQGTTFKVIFPAQESAIASDGGGLDGAVSLNDWKGRHKVLLVDDEESVRAISSRQLKVLGLQVITAQNGQEAVDIYSHMMGEIDLVILDLTMPKMNGEEAFRELRRINPDVRVILASGYSETDVAGRFAGKRIAGYLRKPYTLKELNLALSPFFEMA
ncbi:MAG: response regulator [Pontiellaceae bacterium]|nr:response regulator [Pontiellaceae bacterium]MBN2786402.1 response regulator [Pontiellaceae bacterium]